MLLLKNLDEDVQVYLSLTGLWAPRSWIQAIRKWQRVSMETSDPLGWFCGFLWHQEGRDIGYMDGIQCLTSSFRILVWQPAKHITPKSRLKPVDWSHWWRRASHLNIWSEKFCYDFECGSVEAICSIPIGERQQLFTITLSQDRGLENTPTRVPTTYPAIMKTVTRTLP